MRMRHLLLTSVAGCGLLFATSVQLPQAHAQRGVFLSPLSQWAVTKVAGNEAQGQSGYCAVAKRYESNAIMTIARNQGAETSFALDLQKPSFNVSTPLAVTLDPGAGEQRNYSVQPASSQAFVVKLGRDEGFFKAIDRTGMLRIEVANNSYVFNISDVEIGESKLNSCLASAVQPAAGGNSFSGGDRVPSGRVAASNGNQEFIQGLNGRIQSLEGQNNALKAEIAAVESRVLGGSVVKVDVQNQEAVALRAENMRLKAAMNTGAAAQQNEKLRTLEADNQRLLSELVKQQNMGAEVEHLQTRIDELLTEKAKLENAAAIQSDINVSALSQDIETLKTENQSLKIALTRQGGGDVDGLRQRIAEVERENKSLRENVLLAEQEKFELSKNNIGAFGDNYGSEVAVLKSKIQALETEKNSSDQDNARIGALRAQLASLRADNILLQQELYEKAEPLASLAGVDDADISALRTENLKLKANVEKSMSAHALQDKAIVFLEQENAMLKTQMSSGTFDTATLDGLKERLNAAQSALDESAQKQAAQSQQLASLASENDALKRSLYEKSSQVLASADAQQDIETLKQEIASREAQLAEYEGVPERLDKLLVAYKAVQEEKAALEVGLVADVSKASVEIVEKDAAIASLEDENFSLKQQVLGQQNVVAKLAAAEAQNAVFVEKLGGLQDSVIAMSRLNEEAKSLHSKLALKEVELAEVKSLQEELQKVVAENNDLKEEKSKLAFALETALQMSEQEIAKLEGQQAEDQQVIATLEGENIRLKGEHEAVLAQLGGRDESFEDILAQNETLRGQLDLASELIAAESNAAKRAVKTASTARGNNVQKAELILASASAPVVSEPVSRKVEKTVEEKAVVKVAQKVAPVAENVVAVKSQEKPSSVSSAQSIAEELADIMPAAGDEDVAEVFEAPQVVEDAQDFMDRDLNQAQIYEEQLKRSISNKERIVQSRQDPIDVETLEDVTIDAVVEKAVSIENAVSVENDAVLPGDLQPLESVVEEPVEVRMSQDPFEGIGTAEDAQADVAAIVEEEVIIDNGIDAAPLPVRVASPKSLPVEIATPEIEPDESVSIAATESSGAGSIDRVLKLANVSGVSGVRAVDASSLDAYQWRAGDLYGSGERKAMSSSDQFDGFVQEYLSRTEKRCKGDFAIVPDNSKESGSTRVDSYEVACIGDGVSSSASLLFYNQGGTFTVLAHEAEASKMEQTMRVRDQIFNALAEGRDS